MADSTLDGAIADMDDLRAELSRARGLLREAADELEHLRDYWERKSLIAAIKAELEGSNG